MTPLIREMVSIAPTPEQYHWFDVSAMPEVQLVNLDVVNETPLPFSRCAIVGGEAGAKWLSLLAQEGDVVAYLGWTVLGRDYAKHPSFTFTRTKEGLRLMAADDRDISTDSEIVRGLVAGIGAWLKSLSPATNSYRPEPAGTLAMNRKRMMKGKRPLFVWHTVTIGPRHEPQGSKGGTHASPRLHDRRGHWRNTPSGKRVWVKDCKVGDASRGVVFKDYKIKDAA